MPAPIIPILELLRDHVVKPTGASALSKLRTAKPTLPLDPADDMEHVVELLHVMEQKLSKVTPKLASNQIAQDSQTARIFLAMQAAQAAEYARNRSSTHTAFFWPNTQSTAWIRQIYRLMVCMTPGAYVEYVRMRLQEEVLLKKQTLLAEKDLALDCRFRVDTGGTEQGSDLPELTMSVEGTRLQKHFSKVFRVPAAKVPMHDSVEAIIRNLEVVVEECRTFLREVTAPEANLEIFQDPTPEDIEAAAARNLVSLMTRGLDAPSRALLRKHFDVLKAAI